MAKLMMVAFMMASCVCFAQERGPKGGMERARGERGGMEMRGERGGMIDPVVMAVMNPRIAEKIGLSEEQKTKLREFRGARGANGELNERIRKGMEKQMELLKAEKIDEAAVMAAIDEVFEARKAVAKEQTKRLIAIRSILTPEQIVQATEAMKEFRGPRGRDRNAR